MHYLTPKNRTAHDWTGQGGFVVVGLGGALSGLLVLGVFLVSVVQSQFGCCERQCCKRVTGRQHWDWTPNQQLIREIRVSDRKGVVGINRLTIEKRTNYQESHFALLKWKRQQMRRISLPFCFDLNERNPNSWLQNRVSSREKRIARIRYNVLHQDVTAPPDLQPPFFEGATVREKCQQVNLRVHVLRDRLADIRDGDLQFDACPERIEFQRAVQNKINSDPWPIRYLEGPNGSIGDCLGRSCRSKTRGSILTSDTGLIAQSTESEQRSSASSRSNADEYPFRENRGPQPRFPIWRPAWSLWFFAWAIYIGLRCRASAGSFLLSAGCLFASGAVWLVAR